MPRINDLVAQRRVKDNDNFAIDTASGLFRVTGATVKDYTTDIRTSTVLAYKEIPADKKANEYFPVQNTKTGEHGKIGLKDFEKNLLDKAGANQAVENLEEWPLPGSPVENTYQSFYVTIENDNGQKLKVPISEFYKKILPNSLPDPVTLMPDRLKGNLDTILGFETPSSAEISQYPKVRRWTKRALAEAISDFFPTLLVPKGSIRFENLPPIDQVSVGWCYNIVEEFVTTDEFIEGRGFHYPQGTNIYKNADNYWDCLSGPSVFGVKGKRELNFRTGDVLLTMEDIGGPETSASSVNFTRDYIVIEASTGAMKKITPQNLSKVLFGNINVDTTMTDEDYILVQKKDSSIPKKVLRRTVAPAPPTVDVGVKSLKTPRWGEYRKGSLSMTLDDFPLTVVLNPNEDGLTPSGDQFFVTTYDWGEKAYRLTDMRNLLVGKAKVAKKAETLSKNQENVSLGFVNENCKIPIAIDPMVDFGAISIKDLYRVVPAGKSTVALEDDYGTTNGNMYNQNLMGNYYSGVIFSSAIPQNNYVISRALNSAEPDGVVTVSLNVKNTVDNMSMDDPRYKYRDRFISGLLYGTVFVSIRLHYSVSGVTRSFTIFIILMDNYLVLSSSNKKENDWLYASNISYERDGVFKFYIHKNSLVSSVEYAALNISIHEMSHANVHGEYNLYSINNLVNKVSVL